MNALFICLLLSNYILEVTGNLKDLLLNMTKTTSQLKAVADKIINQKSLKKSIINEDDLLKKKNDILFSFFGKTQTKSVYSNKIKDIIVKTNSLLNITNSRAQQSSLKKEVAKDLSSLNIFGNRILVDSFTKQIRESNDKTFQSLQSDILKLSKSRIKREDIISFIKQKQPAFSISDANNLLVNVHLDSKVPLPGTRESASSQSLRKLKQGQNIENLIKTSPANEASTIKNNISLI